MELLHLVRLPSLTLRVLPLIAVLTTAVFSPTAVAQGCVGSPGASAIEQYCESVPRADGSRERPGADDAEASDDAGPGGSATAPGSGVSGKTSRELSAAGADGQAVERLAGSPSSSGSAGDKTSDGSDTAAVGGSSTGGAGSAEGERVDGPSDPSGSPLKATTNAVQNGSTAGGALIWGLVALSVLGVGGALFLRRGGRTGSTPGPDQN